jgi:hypothetical protein
MGVISGIKVSWKLRTGSSGLAPGAELKEMLCGKKDPWDPRRGLPSPSRGCRWARGSFTGAPGHRPPAPSPQATGKAHIWGVQGMASDGPGELPAGERAGSGRRNPLSAKE